MKKPVLVVMAAGMGSRYGGLKQIDPVDENGHLIIDYSMYDARRAGFETVIFVIKHEIEETFKAAIGDRLSKVMNVKYAYQDLDDLPAGYAVPEGRVKPWGTAHAILAARKVVDGPFAVINADDCYGPEGFRADLQLFGEPPGPLIAMSTPWWGICWATPSPRTACCPGRICRRPPTATWSAGQSAPRLSRGTERPLYRGRRRRPGHDLSGRRHRIHEPVGLPAELSWGG